MDLKEAERIAKGATRQYFSSGAPPCSTPDRSWRLDETIVAIATFVGYGLVLLMIAAAALTVVMWHIAAIMGWFCNERATQLEAAFFAVALDIVLVTTWAFESVKRRKGA